MREPTQINTHSFIRSFVHPFSQQIFTDHLPRARYSVRHRAISPTTHCLQESDQGPQKKHRSLSLHILTHVWIYSYTNCPPHLDLRQPSPVRAPSSGLSVPPLGGSTALSSWRSTPACPLTTSSSHITPVLQPWPCRLRGHTPHTTIVAFSDQNPANNQTFAF